MNRYFTFIYFLIAPLVAFTQQYEVFYENQLGYDIKPILFTISDLDYDLASEIELTYRRAFSKKDFVVLKLSLNEKYRFDDLRSFSLTDTSIIYNRLESFRNYSIFLGYTRQIKLEYFSINGGIAATFTEEDGVVSILEYDNFPVTLIADNFRRAEYYRIGLTPIVGLEIPLFKHWSLLTNFYPTIDYTFGEWVITNGHRDRVSVPVDTKFSFDWNALQDITLLFSF